ncbi:MAG: YicC family protein [Desulfuromonadales bacterium]|nr:YicC family protein [Desulfuromonadales bacterium]
MIKSMTGFGKGEASAEQGRFTVEIRSVNHRYGEVSVRMPRGFLALENDVKKALSNSLKRGKIDAYIQWEEAGGVAAMPQPDLLLARGYAELLRTLSADLGMEEQPSLGMILAQKGVLRDTVAVVEENECLPQLMSAVQSAVSAIEAMRCREGEALLSDLTARRVQVAEWVERIGERSPQVVSEYRLKLKLRLDQLLEGVEIDPTRLAQEVALMADRCDVTEELVRLASHFDQFDEALRTDEPVGRKLDFLMQEMNREINTIGSKSSDAEVTSLVIRIKAEMEKMREQVQNVE